MILKIYTIIHVLISLAGIFTGLVVLLGLLTNKRLERWTRWFLITTILTSVTGFFFPFHGFTPAIALGIFSLVILLIVIYARYQRHLAGAWRWIYVVTALLALYLNMFVGVVQTFEKVPALKVLAPTQSEPPFKITQLVVLALFSVLTIFAVVRFHPEPARPV